MLRSAGSRPREAWSEAEFSGQIRRGVAAGRLYDRSLDGYSNGGHSAPEFGGGIDWAAGPGKLSDLLEYLKTP